MRWKNVSARNVLRIMVTTPEEKYLRRPWTIVGDTAYKYQALCVLRAGKGKDRTYFLYVIDNCRNLSSDITYVLSCSARALRKEGVLDGRYLLVPRVLNRTGNPWQDAWDACADSYRRRVAHHARDISDLREMETIGRSMQIMARSMRRKFTMRDGDQDLLRLARKLTRAMNFLETWYHVGGEDYEG